MNGWDIAIVLGIALAAAATYFCMRRKGKSCTGSCSCCANAACAAKEKAGKLRK